MNEIHISHEFYRKQLDEFRTEFGGTYEIPDIGFYLFGMGNRSKYLFRDGNLSDLTTGSSVKQWNYDSIEIVPNEYTVILYADKMKKVRITENETGVWIFDENRPLRIPGTETYVSLPRFENFRYGSIMTVLHHEILINIVNSEPVPNFLVYRKAWRRDAAMMAMCLGKTGNLELIRPWVMSINDPYDHNNGRSAGNPESEADNLGQTLYLVSLFAGRNFPLVDQILAEFPHYEKTFGTSTYISGRSDFQEVPVYQTKWAIFGLNSLGIENKYSIPSIPDNYSSLFWWDFRNEHIEGNKWEDDDYPYLGWARDHFYGEKEGLISNREYPLTWEKNASEANYNGMSKIDTVYTGLKLSVPHTWHASEIFLYLSEMKINNQQRK